MELSRCEPDSAGEQESDWEDESDEAPGDSWGRKGSCTASPAYFSAAASGELSSSHAVSRHAGGYIVATTCTLKPRSDSSVNRSGDLTRKAAAAGGEARKSAVSWGWRRDFASASKICRPHSRRREQLRQFRCKGFTFEWGGDDAPADVPAYDLSPSFRLLRLSLDSCVDDAPTDILRGFFQAFTSADAAAWRDLAAGASLPFSLACGEDHDGRRTARPQQLREKQKQQTQQLAASYFAPLGDELCVGSSPQRMQLLSPSRFLGTISVTAAAPSSVVSRRAPADENLLAAGTEAPVHEKNCDSASALSNQWEDESSFSTWHRIRVIGAPQIAADTASDVSAAAAAPADGSSALEDEESAFNFAGEVEGRRRAKKKKASKSKRERPGKSSDHWDE